MVSQGSQSLALGLTTSAASQLVDSHSYCFAANKLATINSSRLRSVSPTDSEAGDSR